MQSFVGRACERAGDNKKQGVGLRSGSNAAGSLGRKISRGIYDSTADAGTGESLL
jgi:hypothetical protein